MSFVCVRTIDMDENKKTKECLSNIKRKIAQKTGIHRCVELSDTSAAFSGTKDEWDLYVSIAMVVRRRKTYFSAYMNDHFEWNEWDYASQEEFENAIVQYLCERINQTIKTVIEIKKHKYVRVTQYYLNKETNEWIEFSDEINSMFLTRLFLKEDSLTEEIDEYRI